MLACSGSSRVPAPRPIASMVMAGSGPNALGHGRQDRRAGGRGQLHLDRRLGQRDALEQLGRRRARAGASGRARP